MSPISNNGDSITRKECKIPRVYNFGTKGNEDGTLSKHNVRNEERWSETKGDREITRKSYYTGLTQKAGIRRQEEQSKRMAIQDKEDIAQTRDETCRRISRRGTHCRRQIARGEKFCRIGEDGKHADNKVPPHPRRFEKRDA